MCVYVCVRVYVCVCVCVCNFDLRKIQLAPYLRERKYCASRKVSVVVIR